MKNTDRLTLLHLRLLSAAPGGSLQQLPQVMLEDGGVKLLPLAAQHAAGRLSAVEV